jgi:hypothetical protein
VRQLPPEVCIHGSGCDVRLLRVWEPGVAGEGAVDGVDGANAVAVGAEEVGADAAVSGEGGEGVPVAGDGLMSFGAFEGLLRGVVCPGYGEVSGEGEDLVGLVGESAGEGVSGVVALGPGAVSVGGAFPLVPWRHRLLRRGGVGDT